MESTHNDIITDCKPAAAVELDFSPLDSLDITQVRAALSKAPARTCDFTLGGLYMWERWFGYRAAMVNGTLFVSGLAEGVDGVEAFSLPVGAMDTIHGVRLILDYCRRTGITPVFSAVPEECVQTVLDAAGNPASATVAELTDWADYLYDATDLASLRGKRYNKKRNHVNRFMADNPGWSVEPLTEALIPEATLFCAGRADSSGDDPLADMAAYELGECMKVLQTWGRLPMTGIVLRDASGRMVALSVAEIIGDTAFVHIEKADHTVAGANEMVNKLMAEHVLELDPRVHYLNREEDVGDPGLRTAKEQYHPVARLRKYNIFL